MGWEEELRKIIMQLHGKKKLKKYLFGLNYALQEMLGSDSPEFHAALKLQAAGLVKRGAVNMAVSDEWRRWGQRIHERLKGMHPGILAMVLAAAEKAIIEMKDPRKIAEDALEAAKELDPATLQHVVEHKAYVDELVKRVWVGDRRKHLEELSAWMAAHSLAGRELFRYLPRILTAGYRVARAHGMNVSDPQAMELGNVRSVIEALLRRFRPVLRQGKSREPQVKPTSPLSLAWLAIAKPHRHINEILEVLPPSEREYVPADLRRTAARRILFSGNAHALRVIGGR